MGILPPLWATIDRLPPRVKPSRQRPLGREEGVMQRGNRRGFLTLVAGAGAALAMSPIDLAWAAKAGPIAPGAKDALIVVDVQNCFTKGGSLEVKTGDDIVPLVNKLAKSFENVVLTQDWHTAGHISFASAHAG